MAISDKESMRTRRPPRRSVESKHQHWSDGQKLEAVKTYLMLGSVRLTAGVLKIPEITVKVWRATSWWKELESELKIQDELQLSARLKRVIDRSLSVVEDRLENGNYIYDQKTGKLKRVPVNLKDAHKVSMDSVAQKDLIATRHVEKANDGQIEDKLTKLAEKFAEIATRRITEIKNEERTVEMAEQVVEDVEYEEEEYVEPVKAERYDVNFGPQADPVIAPHVENPNQQSKLEAELALAARRKKRLNAVHDQRKARLQKGKPPVQLQAERAEEAQ